MLPADAEMLRCGPDRHAERLDAEVADALSRMRRVVHHDSLLMVVLVVGINECPIRIQSPGHAIIGRSEEHTSELQSLMRNSYAVFCLKKITNSHTRILYRASYT